MDYTVTVKIPEEVYNAWKEYAKSNNVISFGHRAKITNFTSGHVIDMMSEKLKKGGFSK